VSPGGFLPFENYLAFVVVRVFVLAMAHGVFPDRSMADMMPDSAGLAQAPMNSKVYARINEDSVIPL
jgi:hypothetical protein